MDYLEVLAQLHEKLQPQTYFEIGVASGGSLGLSQSRLTLGIDPGIHPVVQDAFGNSPGVALFAFSSDEFFAKHPRESVLQDARIDLAFIDGLHRFDQVLRDFINVERWSAPSGTIVLHDVIPPNEGSAARDPVPGAWCGDVWQMVSCLQKYRPDLDCLLVRTPPSGLLIARNLDPSSNVLGRNMVDIHRSRPQDGEPYLTAVRAYLGNLSAMSPQEVLDRLSAPAPLPPASANQHRLLSATTLDGRELLTSQMKSDLAALAGEPTPAPDASQLRQPAEPARVGRCLVRFTGGLLTASNAPEQYDWRIDGTSRPLDPSDFSFYGFADSLPDIERQVRRVSLRSGPRVATVVENAVLVPGDRLAGGVLDANGHVVPEARMYQGGHALKFGLPADIDVNAESELDEEVIFLGGDISHFGHFLIEGMARAWILSEVDARVPVVFQSPLAPTPGNWRNEILRALGVTEDRVLPLYEPTRIRRLIVPEPLWELMHVAHERAADPHRAVAEAILGSGGAGSSDQPLYLSRQALGLGARPIVGEAQLEDVLRVNGFLIAYPETMTLADQVRLYNRHADIIAMWGSAAHAAALFSLHRPRVHWLSSPIVHSHDYFLSAALSGVCATFVNCWEAAPTQDGLLHPSLAAEYLAGQGLLKEAFTAKIAPSTTLLRQELEVMRLYVRIRDAVKEQQSIPEDIVIQAELLAKDFWPLSLLLACHQVPSDVRHAEDLIRQFICQVENERDVGRLIKFRLDVNRFAPQVASACSPESSSFLTRIAKTYFALDLPSFNRINER